VVSAHLFTTEDPITAPAGGTHDQAALWANGAAHLTWAVAATYRGHALTLIPGLTDDKEGRAALAEVLHVL